MIGNILHVICGNTYEVNSVKNKICDALEIILPRKFDDDSTLLPALRNRYTCVICVRQCGDDALTQWRQGSLLTGTRARRGLCLSQPDKLLGGTHGKSFRDDAFCEAFHFLGCRK